MRREEKKEKVEGRGVGGGGKLKCQRMGNKNSRGKVRRKMGGGGRKCENILRIVKLRGRNDEE